MKEREMQQRDDTEAVSVSGFFVLHSCLPGHVFLIDILQVV